MTEARARGVASGAGWLGASVLVVAGLWWWLVFRQIIFNAYLSTPRALPCLISESVVCRLAQALCTSDHFLGVRRYYVATFWVGAALLSGGLGLRLVAPGGRLRISGRGT